MDKVADCSIHFNESKNSSTVINSFIEDKLYGQILDNIPIVCVDGLLKKNSKIYLIKRTKEPAKNVWWVQGGRLNKNEKLEYCLLRLCSKELHVSADSIKIGRYLGTFATVFENSAFGCSTHTVNVTYEIELKDGVEPFYDENHCEGRWFPIDGSEEPENGHHPYIKDIMKFANNNKN